MSGARCKKKPRGARRPAPRVSLLRGDWLDVMDSDGVWNVARVLSVPSDDEVEVKYDGWGEEYDEVVRLDSGRVAPYHTYTWAVKCWVRYLNWPLWPSVITIRTPGNLKGVEHLMRENRLFVDFFDNTNFSKRDRCWNQKRNVRPFDKNFDENRRHTNGDLFERSLELCLQSNAAKKMPKFVKGTLPSQYATSVTESVDEMRRSMGDEFWVRSFGDNRERHFLTHVYEDIGREPRDEDDDSSINDDYETAGPHVEEEAQEIVYNSEDSEDESVAKKKPSPSARRAKKVASPKKEPVQPQTPTNHPKLVVMKDDIIVVDDEDDDDSDHRPRRSSKRPRQPSTPRSRRSSTPLARLPSPITPTSPPPPLRTTTQRPPLDESSFPAASYSPQPRPKPSPMGKSPSQPRIDVAEHLPDDSTQLVIEYTPPPRLKPSRHRAEAKKQSKELSLYRKLPAKEISIKTREELGQRLGLETAGSHKEAWMSMLSQGPDADAKDSRKMRIDAELIPDSPKAHTSSKTPRQKHGRDTYLDSLAVNDSENSFITPDLEWSEHGIDYDEDDQDSVPQSPPPKKRKGGERSPKIKSKSGSPRSLLGQYNVMDLDALESSGVQHVDLNKEKATATKSAAARPEKPPALSASDKRKKSPKLSTKRSVLDQKIAEAQKAIEPMNDGPDDTGSTAHVARKIRVKTTSFTGNVAAARRTLSVKANATSDTTMHTTQPPTATVTPCSEPPAPLWSRDSLHVSDDECPAVVDFAPAEFPEVDEVSSDSEEEESKSSTVPTPDQRKNLSSPPDPVSTVSANVSVLDTNSTHTTESPTPLAASPTTNLSQEASVSKSPKSADKEVVAEPQRRFCMMRVGERVGPSLDDMTKTRLIQGERLLVSAPRKFPDQETPNSNRQDAGIAAVPTGASTNSSNSGPSTTKSGISTRAQAPDSIFSSSSGFSINTWFKRNLYATFLKPA